MKISILNKFDNRGGAARAAYRLMQALDNQNACVDYFVAEKSLENDHIHKLKFVQNNNRGKLNQLIQKKYINQNRTELSNTYYSITYNGFDIDNQRKLIESDIINLHWVEQIISNEVLKKLVELNKPLVWTLHDMKPFTGGCHYNAGCREFEQECFNCQQLTNDPHHLPHKVLNEKIKILKDANLTIVSPSQWLAKEAQMSALFHDKEIVVIPNSIEIDIFTPIDKQLAKEQLGIDPNKIVLQFGAQDAKEKRKGFEYLIKAIHKALEDHTFKKLCDEKQILILCLGHPSEDITNLPIETMELGFISDDKQLSLVYSATDLFVLPTLEDNLPNTMLESFACKTPIVAFDTGGITDVVKDGENGIVVPCQDSQSLANGIIELIFDHAKREKYGENGRKFIEEKFKLEDQAKAYISLFEKLILQKDKKASKNFNEYDDSLYDSIIGYSLRKELESNPNYIPNHTLDKKLRELEINLKQKNKEIEWMNVQNVHRFKNNFVRICKTRTFRSPIQKIQNYKAIISSLHELKGGQIEQIPGADDFVQAFDDLCAISIRKNPVKKLKRYKKLMRVWHKHKKII